MFYRESYFYLGVEMYISMCLCFPLQWCTFVLGSSSPCSCVARSYILLGIVNFHHPSKMSAQCLEYSPFLPEL